jgi:hypothetical protein
VTRERVTDERELSDQRKQRPERTVEEAIEVALADEHNLDYGPSQSGIELDSNQEQLFILKPAAGDLAAAQPLRDETPEPAASRETEPMVTVGEARREDEIRAALRGGRQAWEDAIVPTHEWAQAREQDTQERDNAGLELSVADEHVQQIDRALGRDVEQDRGIDLEIDF